MKTRIIYLIGTLLLVSMVYSGCSKKSNFVDLDLLKYGIPLKIQAPEEADVKVIDLNIAKDITVKKGEDFNLQILSSTANTYNVGDVVSRLKEEVEGGPFFSEIIKEEDHGFIFEKKIDENNINYDFRLVRIQGDNEYIFQTGLLGRFTKDQVQLMFDAVN